MDMITLAMAKTYTDSQRLAHTDPSVTLSWDGDESNNEIVRIEGFRFVKVSNDPYDLNRAASLTIGNVTVELRSGEYLVQTENGNSMLMSVNGSTVWAISMEDDDNVDFTKGTWLLTAYTAITFAETVHPIDPKYLGGAALPVVELTTTFANGADLTEKEDKLLKAAWERNTPVVIKLSVSFDTTNSDMCAVWSRADHVGLCNFTLPYGGKTLVLYSTDNAVSWGCTVQ
jgi:hypothetical protein